MTVLSGDTVSSGDCSQGTVKYYTGFAGRTTDGRRCDGQGRVAVPWDYVVALIRLLPS